MIRLKKYSYIQFLCCACIVLHGTRIVLLLWSDASFRFDCLRHSSLSPELGTDFFSFRGQFQSLRECAQVQLLKFCDTHTSNFSAFIPTHFQLCTSCFVSVHRWNFRTRFVNALRSNFMALCECTQIQRHGTCCKCLHTYSIFFMLCQCPPIQPYFTFCCQPIQFYSTLRECQQTQLHSRIFFVNAYKSNFKACFVNAPISIFTLTYANAHRSNFTTRFLNAQVQLHCTFG
jgi:hypothetical protein